MDNQISVIIPLFDTERYVAEALDSVLSQDQAMLEIIVIDDGSKDGGPKIVQTYGPPVRLLRQPNAGPGCARNTGIRASKGNLLAFLDADDIWESDKLRVQLAVLEKDPDVDLVFGHARQFYSPDLDPDLFTRYRYHDEVMPAHLPGALLARRESFLRVGEYSSKLVGSEMEWFMKAQEMDLGIFTVPEVVYQRRLHDRNIGVRHRDSDRDRLEILKAALDRRRAQDRNEN